MLDLVVQKVLNTEHIPMNNVTKQNVIQNARTHWRCLAS